MFVKLLIKKKPGVFDPEAKVIESTLATLGYRVQETTIVKHVEFEIDALTRQDAEQQIQKMCKSFLVNPVLESYHFEIFE